MINLILSDRNGVDNEVKDPQRLSNHIFKVNGEDAFIHEEEGHYFLVNDVFREKIRNFLSQN
ncbi:MAG: hypothetical protein EVA26_02735 [Burkholderiaceae bacterium]|nr:MAG: hypothetical protein EVA26_02735 [Burkholderiaceae bacterium]